ncbi:hypothetical protein [Trebonia kvetii]|uniref:hypothetical protein n=1 Tax=Trebonia kvetii TaxID=2480626 RepID=UPI00165208CB|nr:hypothetical protein [Trebonia kvetii]
MQRRSNTQYVIVWRVITPIGPRKEATRCLTWDRAEQFITMAEGMGAEITEVVFL